MKKKYLHRILALLLAALMLPGSAFTVFAQEAEETAGAETEGTQEPAAEESEAAGESEAEETEEYPDKKLAEVSEIPDGVTIGGIEVGGMSGEEAAELVQDELEEKGQITVDLQIDGETTEVALADLGLYWENEGEVAQLLDTAARGNLLAQYKTVKDIENGEADTEIRYALEDETALAALDAILVPLNVAPQNATLTRNADGGWTITEEVDGIAANSEETLTLIKTELDGWDEKTFEIEVPAEVTRAEITSDVFEGIGTEPIASYHTDYLTVSPNRNNNVAVAASRVNGRVVMPDEVMSMLDMLAPITTAGGYSLAGSYIDGQTVDTVGGGICQMATTFYNAALLLELEIVDRRNHSMSVDYVPLAMDATIYPGGQDLKIRNNTGHALYIESYVSGRDLYVNFYGVDDRPANRQIVYRSETLRLDDPLPEDDQEDLSMKPGTVVYLQGAHRAAVARSYKDVYVDGALVETVELNYDTYRACAGVRRYGPAIDDAGNHYYINNQGYAVGADGTQYRLNPDGTFLDLPPANQTTETTEEETTAPSESTEKETEPETERETDAGAQSEE